MNGNLVDFLSFPPLSNQLIFGINVWIVRVITILISLYFIFYHIKSYRKFIIFISPIYWVLCYCYPLILGELIIWIILINLLKKKKIWVLALILMIFLRVLIQKDKVIVLDKISPKNLSSEVKLRFVSEDSLTIRPNSPLLFRRLSYNKPFFAIKNISKEVINFLDVETIFFGEFHPSEQKGVVVYYWFESFLLVIGVFYLLQRRVKGNINLFLFFSLVYFLISTEILFLRFALLWYVLSKPIALAIEKSNIFWKVLFIIILSYSCLINGINLIRKTDYWLDNKPLVYDFCFKNLQKKNDVYVSKLLGNEDKYCKYYWGKNCRLNNELENSKYVCVFAGELLGKQYDNKILKDWQNIWYQKGYRVLKYLELKDSIVYGYSNYLVIGEKQ